MQRILSYKIYESFDSKELNSIFSFLDKSGIEILRREIEDIFKLEDIDLPISKLNSDHIKYLPLKKAISYGLDATSDIFKLWYDKDGVYKFTSRVVDELNDKPKPVEIVKGRHMYDNYVNFPINGMEIRFNLYMDYMYRTDRHKLLPDKPYDVYDIYYLFRYYTRIQIKDFIKKCYGYQPSGIDYYRRGDVKAPLRLFNALLMLSNGRQPYEGLGLTADISYKLEDYDIGSEIEDFSKLSTGDIVKLRFKNRQETIAQVFENPLTLAKVFIQPLRGHQNIIFLTDMYTRENVKSIVGVADSFSKIYSVEKKKANKKLINLGFNTRTNNLYNIGDLNKNIVAWAVILDLTAIKETKGIKPLSSIKKERNLSKFGALALKDVKTIPIENIDRYLKTMTDKIGNEPIMSIQNAISRLTYYDYVLFNVYALENTIQYLFNGLLEFLDNDISLDSFKEKYYDLIKTSRLNYTSILENDKQILKFLTSDGDYENRRKMTLNIYNGLKECSKLLSKKIVANNKSLENIERSIYQLGMIRDVLRSDRYSYLYRFISDINYNNINYNNIKDQILYTNDNEFESWFKSLSQEYKAFEKLLKVI